MFDQTVRQPIHINQTIITLGNMSVRLTVGRRISGLVLVIPRTTIEKHGNLVCFKTKAAIINSTMKSRNHGYFHQQTCLFPDSSSHPEGRSWQPPPWQPGCQTCASAATCGRYKCACTAWFLSAVFERPPPLPRSYLLTTELTPGGEPLT